MKRINDLTAFLSVVEEGGLTAAARRLDRSLQSISRSLAALEQEVGVELIRRTTRKSNPTEAGIAFYRRVKPALTEIEAAATEAANGQAEPSGVLRVGAPILFAPAYLVPLIAAFMDRCPKVQIELKLSDRYVDLVEEDLDLAVRIGEMPNTELKARRLGELRRVVFGAPSYFSKHGYPNRPEDLRRHQCLVRTVDRNPQAWPFVIDGKMSAVQVNGHFKADNTTAIYAAVAEGLGIGCTPLWQIRALVDRGEVEVVLVEFEPPPVPIHAVWPASRLQPAKTRHFIDFLVSGLKLAGL